MSYDFPSEKGPSITCFDMNDNVRKVHLSCADMQLRNHVLLTVSPPVSRAAPGMERLLNMQRMNEAYFH